MLLKTVGSFVLVSLALVSPAQAQGPCSIQTVTGTYAIQTTALSALGSVFDSQLGPTYELHGGNAVLVGLGTITPDGRVTGTYWGVWVAAPIPVTPFGLRITVNGDCTGEISDEATGDVDKIVVLNNGTEIRSITWGATGGNSVSNYQRITRADDPAPRCGQHTLSGTYMQLCHGFSLHPPASVATVNMLMILTARDGAFSGTLHEKRFGLPASELTESPLAGNYTVHEDCTADISFTLDVMPTLTIKGRGVLFDQGKRAFGLPLGLYAGDTFVAPMGPLTCELVRMGS